MPARAHSDGDPQREGPLKDEATPAKGGTSMSVSASNTSIWLALRNPAFRNLWLATIVSGTCFAAYGTAAFSVLGTNASTFVISLMSTLSALPYALFTLPAGALADMLDRKKILLVMTFWQVVTAICLTLLGSTHLLNAYFILASAFLFHLGF